ncbi:MAG: hypothetical protein K6G16_06620, partial [Lachnospiraceae bacterium]|nr:hypothetical protein [Lachnospiraceae bacterium]
MKKLTWKRLIAGLGTVAMLFGNVADVLPSVAYAAEADAAEEDAYAEELPEEEVFDEEPVEEVFDEEPVEEFAEEAADEEMDDTAEVILRADAVYNDDVIRGYDGITLDFTGETAVTDLAPAIDGYIFTGAALEDGTVIERLIAEETNTFPLYSCVTEDGGTVVFEQDAVITLTYEKIVHINASVVDSFGNEIDEKHTEIELPDFTDTLYLDDPENPPYEKIRRKIGSIGLISRYSPEYDFVQATVNGFIITSIIKEKIRNTDDYVYFYESNGSRERFTEDTTVVMEYCTPESVNASYSYADGSLNLRAELEDENAVPDEAALEVTQVTENTAGYSYDAYMEALENSNESLLSANTYLYDIAFLQDEWEIEPENGSVKISMEFLNRQLSNGLEAEQGSDIAVTHLVINDNRRGEYHTTAEATDLTAGDIEAVAIDTAAARLSDGSDNDVLEFSVDSLSVIAVTRVNRDEFNQASGNGRAVTLDAAVVDEFGKALDEKYAHIALPEFEDILVLSDQAKAPFDKVRTVKRKIGLITVWNNFNYVEASLNGESITGLKKVELPEGGASYFYTADGETWTALEEDATVAFTYKPADEERTSFEYKDANAQVTAILEKPDAIPADAELVVTPIVAGDKSYDAYMEALNGEEGNYSDENALLYDIAFMVKDEDGNLVEFQPEEGAVRITVTFLKNQLTDGIDAQSAQDVTIKHLPLADGVKGDAESTLDADVKASDVKVEDVDATVSVEGKEQVSFTLSGFSVIAVLTQYGWNYNMEDMTDYSLYNILNNFTIFMGGDVTSNHQVGAVAIGGNGTIGTMGASAVKQ